MAIGNSFFYRFVVALAFVVSTDAATLGQACDDTNTCTGDHVVCLNTSCVCDTGYQQNSSADACVVGLGNGCPNGTSDKCLDQNAECTLVLTVSTIYTCQCKSFYYNSGGACEPKKNLGYTCLLSLNVTQCTDPNADCLNSSSTGICQCKTGFYDSNGGGTLDGMCEAEIPLSGMCPSSLPTGVAASDLCSDPKAACKTDGNNYKCLCIDGYYNNNGICTQKVGLGSACPKPDACGTSNAVCSNRSGGGTCICGSGYYDSNGNLMDGNCSIKISLKNACPDPNKTEVLASQSCSDLKATCKDTGSGYKCQCNDDYFDNNGTCTKSKRPTLGEVIGVIGGGIVVLSTVGFIIYRYKHWENKSLKNGYNEDRLATPRNRPVKLFEFPTYVADMHEEQNLKFSRSFEDLKALGLNHKQSVATETKNQMKNRDMHVLPYDHSRVVLRSEHGMDDYINASFLPGYRSVREYIGCQGPLPGTVKDFWRMVWEQNVSAVVMLTLCREHNEEFRIIYVKCEQYWPSVINEPKQFGDVEVQLISSSSFPSYNYNVMKVVCNGRPRIIEHFQFLSWRNMTTNDAFIDFITQVRKHVQPPESAGPLLVHCSNGAGRTGIYIILDHLIQFIDDHDFESSIDIFGMVLKLRENRPNIVETMHQYEFIHDCVNTILARKYSASSQGNTFETIKSSERNVYQNLQKHAYEMLNLN